MLIADHGFATRKFYGYSGQWVDVVSDATRNHERGYHELWARSGEFKTARGLVRALLNAQDLSSPSAVY